jgi:hypothetical protein
VKHPWATSLIVGAGAALYATLAISSMRVKSATFDEAAPRDTRTSSCATIG